MWLFSMIMFLTSVLFLGLSIAIYRGKTDLIHDYHQTKVTDKASYGKAFGKALSVIAAALFLSGAAGLLGESTAALAVGILIGGIALGVAAIIAVQRKYNNGIF